MTEHKHHNEIPPVINPIKISKEPIEPIGIKHMTNKHDKNFDLEFDVGYNKLIYYKHANAQTQGLYYKQMTSLDIDFKDLSKFKFFETKDEWNKIEGLEKGREYIFLKKVKDLTESHNYARIKLLEKPHESNENIFQSFCSIYERLQKLKINKKVKNSGISKLNIGVCGFSGDGKSVLISSLKTILKSQEYQNTEKQVYFNHVQPDQKKGEGYESITINDENDKFNLIEFPQYFDDINDADMKENLKNELNKCHSIIFAINWDDIRQYMLAEKFKHFDKHHELYTEFSQDFIGRKETFDNRLKLIEKIREVNKKIPIIIAITQIDMIHSFQPEKFNEIFEYPVYLSLKGYVEQKFKDKFSIFLCAGYKVFLDEINPVEYYSKGVMIASLFLSAFQNGNNYALSTLTGTDIKKIQGSKAEEDKNFCNSIYAGVSRAVGRIPDFDITTTHLYYSKARDAKIENFNFEEKHWNSIEIHDDSFQLENLAQQTEYIVVLKNDTDFDLDFGKFKTKRTGNERVEENELDKGLEAMLNFQKSFCLQPHIISAKLPKLNIGIYGLTNSGKSSLIAGLKTIMKNQNKLLNEEVITFEYEHPAPRNGLTKKFKRTDFNHNNYFSTYEFAENCLESETDYKSIVSQVVQRKIHSGVLLIDASRLKDMILEEKKMLEDSEKSAKVKDSYATIMSICNIIKNIDNVKVNFIVSKLDEVFIEDSKKLSYNQIIEHPLYIEMREYIGKYFGSSIEIFPLISFCDNPFLEYPSDECLENSYITQSYMCLKIFNSAIDQAKSHLQNHFECIVIRQRRNKSENKPIGSFFIEKKQKRELWSDLQNLIKANMNFKTEVNFLDTNFKIISGTKVETRDVTEESDGCLYVNIAPKEKNPVINTEDAILEEIYLCVGTPDNAVQPYEKINSSITLQELRKYLTHSDNIANDLPSQFRFCKLKNKAESRELTDFRMIHQSDEDSIRLREIIYEHPALGSCPLFMTLSRNITLQILEVKEKKVIDKGETKVVKEINSIHTFEELERESATLALIRSKLENDEKKIKINAFLRVESIQNQTHYLPITKRTEDRYLLKEIDIEEIAESKRIFKVFVKL